MALWSSTLPEGKDGLLFLTNMVSGKSYLGSTEVFKGECYLTGHIVCNNLDADNSIIDYRKLFIVKSNLPDCVIINRREYNDKYDKLLCANIGNINSKTKAYNTDHRPFFIINVKTGSREISSDYNIQAANITHYRDFCEANKIFET